jgi:hypothetical protein
MQAICIYRCVQAPAKASAMAAAKQGSDFAVHPGAEDPAFDKASHVGCDTLPRIPRLSRTIFPRLLMQRLKTPFRGVS